MKKALLTLFAAAVCLSSAAQMKISGTVKDSAGKPVAGVVVSDGFSCANTDAKGRYKLAASKDAFYVFYSIPAEYGIATKDGHPDFYKKIEKGVKRYDFTLAPLEGGVEKEFKLVMVADPQAQCDFHVKRFERETVPDIRAYVDAQSVPCYGVTLGDMAYSEGKANAVPLMPKMRRAMGYDRSHLLFFQTMGNHDNAFAPVATDGRSSNINLAYQRPFEEVFGPVNYSWNRGDVHIVSMKDIEYLLSEKSSKYRPAFSREQYEWLCQDLSQVPDDKMVILCVHIGLYDRTNPYLAETRQLLKRFKEAHIMVGHTHFMNHHVNKLGVYEHVHAAASGAFWWSCINGDGVPNGYTVYDVEGAHIKNWKYKCVGRDENYQIRMYRGDGEFGGEYEKVRFPYSHDTVLANVFMADGDWKVELYEDGVLTGEMERMKPKKTEYPEVGSSQDWWAIGYHLGVIGRSYGKVKTGRSKMNGGGRNGYLTSCNHMYRMKLKNPDAKEIRVVATDANGNVYEQTKFTENYDYSENELMNRLYTTRRSVLDKEY